jgi:hypothetical protein
MAGSGPAPKPFRSRRNAPARGDWKLAPEGGWQHELPAAPAGLRPGSIATWEAWLKAWWAANWTQDDLPGLRLLIRIYDRVNRGDLKRLGELRQLMDSYGVTPKGQQDRRWQRPEPPRPSGFASQRSRSRQGWDPRTALRSSYDPAAGTYVPARREEARLEKERLKRIAAQLVVTTAGEGP